MSRSFDLLYNDDVKSQQKFRIVRKSFDSFVENFEEKENIYTSMLFFFFLTIELCLYSLQHSVPDHGVIKVVRPVCA